MTQIIQLDLRGVNCYLMPVPDGFILVDCGGYTFNDRPLTNRREILETQLQANGCIPGKLKLVILTHGDIDHNANCKFLKETYKPKIVIHRADAELTKLLTVEKIFSNFKFHSLPLRLIARLMHPLFVKICLKIIAHYQEFEADELIDETFDLTAYGLDAQLIHIPGHTKGSIGLITGNGDFICGDILANTKRPSIAMNALDFGELRRTLKNLPADKITMVYPGHGDPFAFKDLRFR